MEVSEMRFAIRQRELSEMLDFVRPVVVGKPVIPAAGGVLIEAIDDTVKVTATDLDTWATASYSVIPDAEGAAVVPAKEFFSLVAKLPPEQSLTLEAEGGKAKLDYGFGQVEFSTYPVEEFPPGPEPAEAMIQASFGEEFGRKLKQVIPFCGRDDLRPLFTGVEFSFTEEGLTLAATDAHRLAVARIGGSFAEHSAVVPVKALKVISNAPTVDVAVAENWASFRLAWGIITTRLIEGQYPDWREALARCFNEPGLVSVEVAKDDIRAALGRAAVVAGTGKDTPVVRLTVNNSGLVLLTETAEGSFREEIGCEVRGDISAFEETAYNLRYLVDAVDVVSGDTVRAEYYGETAPLKVEEQGFTAIVLPIRLT